MDQCPYADPTNGLVDKHVTRHISFHVALIYACICLHMHVSIDHVDVLHFRGRCYLGQSSLVYASLKHRDSNLGYSVADSNAMSGTTVDGNTS